jgi:hypothetical protein
MKSLQLHKVLFVLVALCLPAFGTTRYVAQTAGTFSGGSACNGQTAITVATFDGLTLSPGDTTYLCGTLTAPAGSANYITIGQSGTSGNLISLIFDTGASLTATYWGGEAINIEGNSYVLLNGGTSGTIQASANGTAQSCVTASATMSGATAAFHCTSGTFSSYFVNGAVFSGNGFCIGASCTGGYNVNWTVTGGGSGGTTMTATSSGTSGLGASTTSGTLSFDYGECVGNGSPAGNATNVTVENLTCANLYVDSSVADNGGEDTYAIDIWNTSNLVIQGNTIHDVKWAIRNSYEVRNTYSNLTVTNNTEYNMDHGWFDGDSSTGQINSNSATVHISSGSAVLTSSDNPFLSTDAGYPICVAGAGASGGELCTTVLSYQSANQVTLSANASTTVNTTNKPIYIGAVMSGYYIYANTFGSMTNWDNTADNNHHDWWHHSSNSDATRFTNFYLYNNTASGDIGANANGGVFSFPGVQATSAAYVFNNILVNTSATHCWANGFVSLYEVGTWTVANNTFVSSCPGDNGLDYNDNSTGLTFENNVIDGPSMEVMYFQATNLSTVDWNDYYSSPSWTWLTTSTNTFATWKGASGCNGCDSHSAVANPNLNSSYIPNPGSPLIGNGANLWTTFGCASPVTPGLGAGCSDEAGNARTNAAFTIGALNPATSNFSLTITVTGSGSVSDSQGGIVNCKAISGTCTASYASGTVDTLTATTVNTYIFTGFTGGGCPASPSNRYPCTITLSANESVTAAFSTNCNLGSTYPCARTDLTAPTYPALPPQVGPNTCSATTPWTCGNLTGAGTVFTDPNFGTNVIRATDSTTGKTGILYQANIVDTGGSGDNNHFSCDDSMIYTGNTGSWLFPMNFFGVASPPTKMYGTTLSSTNGLAINGSTTSAAWGHECPTDAHRLFVVNGTQLGYYDFTGNSPSGTPPSEVDLYNFTSSANCLGSGYTETWNVFGESDQSDTDFAVGFSNSGGQGTGVQIAVWRNGSGCRVLNTSTDAVTGDWGPTGTISGTPCTGTIHNVKIMKGGGSNGWLIWSVTSPSAGCSAGGANNQQWLWNYSSATLTGSLTTQATTFAGGHFTEGINLIANVAGDANPDYVVVRPQSTLTATGIVPTFPSTTPMDSHFGWNQLNDADPFFGTFSRYTGTPNTHAWDSEVVGFQPVASGLQYREASTFSTDLSPYFDAQYAIGSISQTGNYFMWTSDWGNTLGGTASSGSTGAASCVPNGPDWATGTAYASSPYASSFPANGGIITPAANNVGGYSYQVSAACTSGSTEPNPWNQTVSGTSNDNGGTGGCTWTNINSQTATNACRSEVFVAQLGNLASTTTPRYVPIYGYLTSTAAPTSIASGVDGAIVPAIQSAVDNTTCTSSPSLNCTFSYSWTTPTTYITNWSSLGSTGCASVLRGTSGSPCLVGLNMKSVTNGSANSSAPSYMGTQLAANYACQKTPWVANATEYVGQCFWVSSIGYYFQITSPNTNGSCQLGTVAPTALSSTNGTCAIAGNASNAPVQDFGFESSYGDAPVWATGTAYTQGTVEWNTAGGNNFFYVAQANCTSGTGPTGGTWNTTQGGTTNDNGGTGGCNWTTEKTVVMNANTSARDSANDPATSVPYYMTGIPFTWETTWRYFQDAYYAAGVANFALTSLSLVRAGGGTGEEQSTHAIQAMENNWFITLNDTQMETLWIYAVEEKEQNMANAWYLNSPIWHMEELVNGMTSLSSGGGTDMSPANAYVRNVATLSPAFFGYGSNGLSTKDLNNILTPFCSVSTPAGCYGTSFCSNNWCSQRPFTVGSFQLVSMQEGNTSNAASPSGSTPNAICSTSDNHSGACPGATQPNPDLELQQVLVLALQHGANQIELGPCEIEAAFLTPCTGSYAASHPSTVAAYATAIQNAAIGLPMQVSVAGGTGHAGGTGQFQ